MIAAQELASCYDDVAATYEDPKGTTDAQKLYWLTYEHLTWQPVAALLNAAPNRLQILDAGGGSGKYGVRMAELGHQVTVLDLSPQMLEKAKQAFAKSQLSDRGTFMVGNILALPFAEAAFDLVFCEGDPVSYCVDAYPQAISELLRVAKPGAPLVLGLDNRYDRFVGEIHFGEPKNALSILTQGRAKCPYGMPVHAFTLRELETTIGQQGGIVDEIFGKPVLFYELIAALKATKGADVNLMELKQEIFAYQERMIADGYSAVGGHFQVMARKRP